ncbi:MAG: radical SAM family heme chaperone HemW [Proteobacteria bacterium]|nr:radical SAM family heme chaperone HemW [Pseudomonadota bacterium]
MTGAPQEAGPPTGVPLGVYVHWPYCARICPYCDFNVVRERGRTEEKTALGEAILADLTAHRAATGPRRLVSVFLGGGTPSLMDPALAARIVEACRTLWTAGTDLEVTLEANPTDAETDRFAAFRDAGVNRLSLGLQALDDAALKMLGRNHDAAAGRRAAVRAASTFPRLSLDLIYARPGQTPQAWARELGEAVTLGAEHISPYQLTVEAGTAFDRAVRRGTLRPPGDEDAAALYETTQAVLEAAGFEAYEVSNHARGEAARSRHNLVYWRGWDYVGAGPGAHGRLTLDGERWATAAPGAIADYIAAAGGPGPDRERLDPRDAALERLLMGLRTVEGVALAELAALEIPPQRLEDLAALGLLRIAGGRLVATASGRPVLDRLTAEIAGD